METTPIRLICEECLKPIEPLDGYIFQGNVYIISENVEERYGIIGNNIISDEKISESCYCKKCLTEMLIETEK